MKTIKVELIYTLDEVKKPYLKLLSPHTNPDGSVISIIPPENVGVVRDCVYMDMPIMYHKLNPIAMNTITKNNYLCQLEVDDYGEIKKINDLVILVI